MASEDLYTMTFFYIVLSIKVLYILVASIVNLHGESLDARMILLSTFKKYLKQIKDILSFAFIVFVFNPFDKKPVEVLHHEKISLFIFALIGIANVKWNVFLNLIGFHIPFFESYQGLL